MSSAAFSLRSINTLAKYVRGAGSKDTSMSDLPISTLDSRKSYEWTFVLGPSVRAAANSSLQYSSTQSPQTRTTVTDQSYYGYEQWVHASAHTPNNTTKIPYYARTPFALDEFLSTLLTAKLHYLIGVANYNADISEYLKLIYTWPSIPVTATDSAIDATSSLASSSNPSVSNPIQDAAKATYPSVSQLMTIALQYAETWRPSATNTMTVWKTFVSYFFPQHLDAALAQELNARAQVPNVAYTDQIATMDAYASLMRLIESMTNSTTTSNGTDTSTNATQYMRYHCVRLWLLYMILCTFLFKQWRFYGESVPAAERSPQTVFLRRVLQFELDYPYICDLMDYYFNVDHHIETKVYLTNPMDTSTTERLDSAASEQRAYIDAFYEGELLDEYRYQLINEEPNVALHELATVYPQILDPKHINAVPQFADSQNAWYLMLFDAQIRYSVLWNMEHAQIVAAGAEPASALERAGALYHDLARTFDTFNLTQTVYDYTVDDLRADLNETLAAIPTISLESVYRVLKLFPSPQVVNDPRALTAFVSVRELSIALPVTNESAIRTQAPRSTTNARSRLLASFQSATATPVTLDISNTSHAARSRKTVSNEDQEAPTISTLRTDTTIAPNYMETVTQPISGASSPKSGAAVQERESQNNAAIRAFITENGSDFEDQEVQQSDSQSTMHAPSTVMGCMRRALATVGRIKQLVVENPRTAAALVVGSSVIALSGLYLYSTTTSSNASLSTALVPTTAGYMMDTGVPGYMDYHYGTCAGEQCANPFYDPVLHLADHAWNAPRANVRTSTALIVPANVSNNVSTVALKPTDVLPIVSDTVNAHLGGNNNGASLGLANTRASPLIAALNSLWATVDVPELVLQGANQIYTGNYFGS